MKVTGQPHFPVALSPGKKPQVPSEMEVKYNAFTIFSVSKSFHGKCCHVSSSPYVNYSSYRHRGCFQGRADTALSLTRLVNVLPVCSDSHVLDVPNAILSPLQSVLSGYDLFLSFLKQARFVHADRQIISPGQLTDGGETPLQILHRPRYSGTFTTQLTRSLHTPLLLQPFPQG
jgi:hypothetical protein